MMTVSIIICTRDRYESLLATLRMLGSVEPPADARCELLVVDNGSTDATTRLDLSCLPSWLAGRLVREPTRGQARARNTGIALAKGQIIAFIDDDIRPEARWLKEILSVYRDRGVAAVLGPVLLEFDSPPPAWISTFHRALLAERDYGNAPLNPFIGHLVGANMSFRREAAETIGPFQELLGPGRAGYWDDSEFSARLQRAGFRQYYQPKAVVHHQISAARLSVEYFRNAMFAQGVSSYIAGQLGAFTPGEHSYWDVTCDTLRRVRDGIQRVATGGQAVTCSEADLRYRMKRGYAWACWQGMEQLVRRYGQELEARDTAAEPNAIEPAPEAVVEVQAIES